MINIRFAATANYRSLRHSNSMMPHDAPTRHPIHRPTPRGQSSWMLSIASTRSPTTQTCLMRMTGRSRPVLPIKPCRIMRHREINLEQPSAAYLVGIDGDLHGFQCPVMPVPSWLAYTTNHGHTDEPDRLPVHPKGTETSGANWTFSSGHCRQWRTASSCGHGVVVRTPDSQKIHLHCRPWLTVA